MTINSFFNIRESNLIKKKNKLQLEGNEYIFKNVNVISNFSSSHFFKSHCRFLVFFVIFLTVVISEMKILIFKKFKKYFSK